MEPRKPRDSSRSCAVLVVFCARRSRIETVDVDARARMSGRKQGSACLRWRSNLREDRKEKDQKGADLQFIPIKLEDPFLTTLDCFVLLGRGLCRLKARSERRRVTSGSAPCFGSWKRVSRD
ncbi:hypothetical protein L596_028107 [Steinernema carpocapsae]|uniref:Uncharacterized protein n=1 Tax=Steinernema carpocapsae TaxID=34508 RepID=A0A4U5LXG4_STECR|nr:hypothetical protein L596_028107 [Steinernema carpocapsae]